MTTRRDFLKKTCLGGSCLCGFGSIIYGKEKTELATLPDDEISKNEVMALKWITELLDNLDNHLTEPQLRQIVKSTSIAHYINLDMDNMLAPFKGKLDDFVHFLEEKWGWKVAYENNGKALLIDEAKPYCVCPLVRNEKNNKYPALCYCSEGFAERMFSTVCESPVKVTVVASVQRGNKTCIYRVEFA